MKIWLFLKIGVISAFFVLLNGSVYAEVTKTGTTGTTSTTDSGDLNTQNTQNTHNSQNGQDLILFSEDQLVQMKLIHLNLRTIFSRLEKDPLVSKRDLDRVGVRAWVWWKNLDPSSNLSFIVSALNDALNLQNPQVIQWLITKLMDENPPAWIDARQLKVEQVSIKLNQLLSRLDQSFPNLPVLSYYRGIAPTWVADLDQYADLETILIMLIEISQDTESKSQLNRLENLLNSYRHGSNEESVALVQGWQDLDNQLLASQPLIEDSQALLHPHLENPEIKPADPVPNLSSLLLGKVIDPEQIKLAVSRSRPTIDLDLEPLSDEQEKLLNQVIKRTRKTLRKIRTTSTQKENIERLFDSFFEMTQGEFEQIRASLVRFKQFKRSEVSYFIKNETKHYFDYFRRGKTPFKSTLIDRFNRAVAGTN